MKNFLKKFLLLSLPVLPLMILINYYGDAARLFESGYEKKLSVIIESGKFVTNSSNYDDRIFQRELILSNKIWPKVVVFGSSRAMLISAELYGDSLLFNNSVSYACIEDIVSLYQIYKTNHKLPKKIIIGIDPWLFSENAAHTRWKSIGSYYDAFTGNSNSHNLFNSKYEQLFSLSYFQSSLKNLRAKFRGSGAPVATTNKFNIKNTKIADGSIVYADSIRNISTKDVNAIIKTFLSTDVSNTDKIYIISDKVQNLFEKLIGDIKANNIEVEFFLSPFPKAVYDKRADNYKEIEEVIKNFAQTQKIKVYGTYNSNTLAMDNSYFYDDRHCNEKAMKEIFNKSY